MSTKQKLKSLLLAVCAGALCCFPSSLPAEEVAAEEEDEDIAHLRRLARLHELKFGGNEAMESAGAAPDLANRVARLEEQVQWLNESLHRLQGSILREDPGDGQATPYDQRSVPLPRDAFRYAPEHDLYWPQERRVWR